MKKNLRTYGIELILFVVGLVLALALFPSLPEQIPMTWRNGEVVSVGPKAFVFLFPVLLLIPLAVHRLMQIPTSFFPFLKGLDQMMAVLIAVVLLSCEIGVLLLAKGVSFRMEIILLVELLLVPIVLGAFVAKKLLGMSVKNQK